MKIDRDKILKRTREFNNFNDEDIEFLINTCTVFECLLQQGFEYAEDDTKKQWVTRKLTTMLSIEFVEDLRNSRVANTEIINVLVEELVNEIPTGTKLAFVKLSTITISNDDGDKYPRITVSFGGILP